MTHPWAILPALVEQGILTREDARSLVMGHQDMHRRALQEIHALLPELVQDGLLEMRGMERIRHVVLRVQMQETPDLT